MPAYWAPWPVNRKATFGRAPAFTSADATPGALPFVGERPQFLAQFVR